MHAVKPLYLNPVLLTIIAALWLALTGCGSGAGDPGEALRISLAFPAEESAEDFFLGVARRELTIENDGEARTVAWIQGGTAELKLEAGAKITFSAYYEDGSLLARGEAAVGKEKSITIPLRRPYN